MKAIGDHVSAAQAVLRQSAAGAPEGAIRYLRAATLVLVLTMACASAAGAQTLLLESGFEQATELDDPGPGDCGETECWQAITGLDNSTGFSWPGSILGGGAGFHLLADTQIDETTIRDHMFNQLLDVTGPDGTVTRALYSQVTRSGCCGADPQGDGETQNAFQLLPSTEVNQLYISYWLKFQGNLAGQLSGQRWRYLFSWKTAGDYRVVINVLKSEDERLYWRMSGDNNANCELYYPAELCPPLTTYWERINTDVPVPVGEWFKLEVFWHRNTGVDGRVWMAVNGRVVFDRSGPNVGALGAPIDRISIANVYGGGPYPMYQWMDDLEIWDDFPPGAAGPRNAHPWRALPDTAQRHPLR